MEEQFLWTLLETAVKSGNSEELIRPFPSSYFNATGEKDFDGLISDVERRSRKLYNWIRRRPQKLFFHKIYKFFYNLFLE